MFFLKTPASLAYIDLSVPEVTMKPSKPTINQDVIITIRVKNGGDESLVNSYGLSTYEFNIINFRMNNITWAAPTKDKPVLKGGYVEYKFSGQWSAAGDNKVYFKINNVQELVEEKLDAKGGWTVKLYDNNSLNKTLAVYPTNKIDIAVDAVRVDRNFPAAGDLVKLIATLKNTGTVSITDEGWFYNTNVRADFPGFEKRTVEIDKYPSFDNPWDSGEKFNYIYYGTYPSKGENSFKFSFDTMGLIAEALENNNSSTTAFRVYESQSDADDFKFLDINVTNISTSSIRVKWTTDRKTTGRLIYRKKTFFAPEERTAIVPFSVGHSVDITGLYPNTKHWIIVEGTASTTPKQSDILEVTTLGSDKPAILAGPDVIAKASSTFISWTTNILANSYVMYNKNGGKYAKAGTDEKLLDHNVEIKNLTVGDYEYYVISSSSPNTAGSAVTSPKKKFSIGAVAGIIIADQTVNKPATSDKPAADKPAASANISTFKIKNAGLYKNLSGKIILKVESKGEAYYINPGNETVYYLGRPEDAFEAMKTNGIGISNVNVKSIPIGITSATGLDSDQDGLSDLMEDAIGTNKNKPDSDGDSFDDKIEAQSGFNFNGSGKIAINQALTNSLKGKILLQVENKGEAWYINPGDGKRYFLGRPADAFNVMRKLGVGISNKNFNEL